MDYKAHTQKLNTLMGKMGKEIPETMGAFMNLHALSAKVKELIALAIGISVRCNGCISIHVNDALKSGASHEEIMETIGVAVMMGGGPSVVYGTEAMEALNQYEGKE